MIVVVDTPIWSLALRRRSSDLAYNEVGLVRELEALIDEGRVSLVGSVRQEVLSGIRTEKQFERVANALRAFPDEPCKAIDCEAPAIFSNECRRGGIIGGTVDFQICAVADRLKGAIFTADGDFERFARFVPVRLHESRFLAEKSR